MTLEIPAGQSKQGRLSRCASFVQVILGIGLALTAMALAAFGVYDEIFTRSLLVLAAGCLVFLMRPLSAGHSSALRWPLAAADAVLLATLVFATFRFITIQDDLFSGLYQLNLTDQVAAWLGIAVILELTRRLFGLALSTVAALLIAYALFGGNMPGGLGGIVFFPDEIVKVVWYSFDGVFGQMLSIVIGVILIFMVFGAVLEATGAGATLIRVAFALSGGTRGGPAYAAVISSALFGTISGSVTANVVSTGVLTIPLAKRRGFKAHFAGAVETAASSAGQFTPPVMGAVAFIMADLSGVPYLTVCIMSLLPALLYYAGLMATIAVEAVKFDLRPSADDIRMSDLNWRDALGSLVFLIPLAAVVLIIVAGRSPAQAGLVAVLLCIGLGFVLLDDMRRNPKLLLTGLKRGGENAAQIILAVAAVGIVVGVLNLTGLGNSFAAVISQTASDNLFLALVTTMVGCLVLGMGMPTVPAYLIIILVMGPGLSDLGIATPIVHLFVIYFAVLSSLTPPIALAAFAAAPIAEANPIRIAITAVRVALVGFVIPFAFVFHPEIALFGNVTALGLIWGVGGMLLAIWLITTATAGFGAMRLAFWSRVLRVVLAAGILQTRPELAIIAAIAALALVAVQDRSLGVKQNIDPRTDDDHAKPQTESKT